MFWISRKIQEFLRRFQVKDVVPTPTLFTFYSRSVRICLALILFFSRMQS